MAGSFSSHSLKQKLENSWGVFVSQISPHVASLGPRVVVPSILVGLALAISLSEYRTFRLRVLDGGIAFLPRELSPSSALSEANEALGSPADEEGPESDPLTGLQRRIFRVDCGDTLSSILREIGISFSDIDVIGKVLGKHHNVKHLQIGQLLELEWEVEHDVSTLKSLETMDSLGNRIRLTATGNPTGERYTVSVQKRELTANICRVSGTIHSTFDKAARSQGVPSSLVGEAARALSPLIKATRLRPNSTFEIVYEESRDKNTGDLVGKRRLKYVAVSDGTEMRRVYSFGNQYYTEAGESLKPEFLTIPLRDKNPRISSKFGLRKHPVLGVVKRHYGVDYAARYGADVYAAAHGTVVAAERRGAYGLYVRIRHANGFETAYGHLSKILVQKGQKVSQGTLIGLVGKTGRATGPHLHYEVIRSQVRVDPQKYCSLGATKLTGEDLSRFKRFKQKINDEIQKAAVDTGAV